MKCTCAPPSVGMMSMGYSFLVMQQSRVVSLLYMQLIIELLQWNISTVPISLRKLKAINAIRPKGTDLNAMKHIVELVLFPIIQRQRTYIKKLYIQRQTPFTRVLRDRICFAGIAFWISAFN